MKTNVDWKAWGKVDPLYGVAYIPGKSRQNGNPWTDEEFYQLGFDDWSSFLPHWERYGVNRESCLEVGCGAGRITRQLSGSFNCVHAVDVSESMIEYARGHVNPDSVHFYVTNGIALPLSEKSVTAIFSTHVFQHLETIHVGAQYFRELNRVLAVGGTMMIHLPIVVWPTGTLVSFHRFVDDGKKAIGRIRSELNRQAFRLGIKKEPPILGTVYEVDWLYKTLFLIGFRDIEFGIYPNVGDKRPGAGLHSFVFARK